MAWEHQQTRANVWAGELVRWLPRHEPSWWGSPSRPLSSWPPGTSSRLTAPRPSPHTRWPSASASRSSTLPRMTTSGHGRPWTPTPVR
ncbi:hypothetical protein [Streptomyces sp. Y7]|uniref:hypothetical protein n=1 Tax=Streptomyces sp. Y7 TaxID=3342392 RepID=UPI0037123ACE